MSSNFSLLHIVVEQVNITTTVENVDVMFVQRCAQGEVMCMHPTM